LKEAPQYFSLIFLKSVENRAKDEMALIWQ
jgi:hypothetical protein